MHHGICSSNNWFSKEKHCFSQCFSKCFHRNHTQVQVRRKRLRGWQLGSAAVLPRSRAVGGAPDRAAHRGLADPRARAEGGRRARTTRVCQKTSVLSTRRRSTGRVAPQTRSERDVEGAFSAELRFESLPPVRTARARSHGSFAGFHADSVRNAVMRKLMSSDININIQIDKYAWKL